MRIAVSGASGFIGQHVLHELHSRNLDAIALSQSAGNRYPQLGVSQWIELDIANPPRNPLETMGCPDVLIHLAWGGLPNYQSSHHVEVELPAQLSFLTACIRDGLKHVVVAGTCYEYGLASGKLKEDTPTQPCTQYGIAKDRLHEALLTLNREFEFELTWLRLFYLYGAGQSKKSLFHSLHAAIERGDRAFDMSGGEQMRDFLPIGEAARLIVELALRTDANGTFNICSGKPVMVKDVVRSWINASHSSITMNLGQLPYSPNESMAFWGCRKKLEHLLLAENL